MTPATVSVVVVSRGRPGLLTRCLTGLDQLCHGGFEVVVVADAAGCDAIRAAGYADRIKMAQFDAPNISEARNIAVNASSGDVIAFIDDDAVPEPTWLGHLATPFATSDVAAAGGFVIGRNGISFQWTARAVDRRGRKTEIDHRGEDPFLPALPDGWFPKTEGTNFAVRRDWLVRLGGFDPAFRFFLDETDLNIRLAAMGGKTIFVPRAIVHHGFAASSRRAGDRAPTDLTEIGASSVVFLRKHATGCDLEAELARIEDEHRNALLRYMVDGGLEPADIPRRLLELRAGFSEGLGRTLVPLASVRPVGESFKPFVSRKRTPKSRWFAGRPWNRRSLRHKAQRAVAAGEIVTVFRFSPTALTHRVRFREDGWWEQWGGLFGRADREAPYFRLQTFQTRVQKEWARVAALRQCRSSDTNS